MIIPISKYQRIPSSLVKLLDNPLVLKAGRAVTGDLNKLRRDYGLHHVGALEIGSFCSRRGLIQDGRQSLSKICEEVLGRPLNKHDRLSDWEADPLTPLQIHYAALDVWASLRLYTVAMTFAVLGTPIKLPVSPGTYVALCPNMEGEAIAYGEINDSVTDTPLPSKLSVTVKVNKALIPGAILEPYNKALEDFGETPFSVIIPIAMLRAEKKALCHLPPTTSSTTVSAQEREEELEEDTVLGDNEDSSDDEESSLDSSSSLPNQIPSVGTTPPPPLPSTDSTPTAYRSCT